MVMGVGGDKIDLNDQQLVATQQMEITSDMISMSDKWH